MRAMRELGQDLTRADIEGGLAAARAARDAMKAPKERRVTEDAKPKHGVCLHCGEPTKGGRFVPGHDARLKSDLNTQITQGGMKAAGALIEMLVRNWAKTHHIDAARAAGVDIAACRAKAKEPGLLAIIDNQRRDHYSKKAS